MLEIIGDAAPEMAKIFVEAGKAAREHGSGSSSIHIDRIGFTVAIKTVDEDTSHDRYGGQAIFNLMIRADAMGADRIGLATGKALDRLIARHESAMGALFIPWRDLAAPFAGCMLSTDQTFGEIGDRWAPHLITRGRWRMSLWTIQEGN